MTNLPHKLLKYIKNFNSQNLFDIILKAVKKTSEKKTKN